MISAAVKSDLVKEYATSATDSGNQAAQVAIFTTRVKELTEHLKANKHDFMARRGLLQLVGKRKRALKYIAKKDGQQYLDLIAKLGIRR